MKWLCLLAIAITLLGCSSVASPKVVDGPGVIVIGRELDVTKQPPEIKITGVPELGPLAFVAHFNSPMKTTSFSVTIASVNAGAETLVLSHPVSVAAPGYTVVWATLPIIPGLGTGPHRIRVLEQDVVLAQRDFEVIPR